MNVRKHIPNTITCGNLLCGCLGVVQAFEGNLVWAAYLVGIAAVLDFFDGFAARLLKVSSPIGKDLDSLADMVTFGFLPGIVMFVLLATSVDVTEAMFYPGTEYLKYIAFMIPVFSALRLAKFNNDTRQSDSFIGVPTPANAMLICSLPLMLEFNNFEFILDPILLSVLTVVMSLLLVAELPLFALKFKHFKWAGNEIRFVFLALSLILLIVLQFLGIALVILLYILLSLINNILLKKQTA